MTGTKFFVIVPVHNRWAYTSECLEALEQQTFRNFQVVVVNDGSTDETALQLQQRFPYVRAIVGDGNWWWTRSVNEGIRWAVSAGATHVLLLNNDVWISSDYMQVLWDACQSRPFALIGSLSLTADSPHRAFFTGIRSWNKFTLKQVQYQPLFGVYAFGALGLRPSVALNGRGTLIPVEVWKRIGALDQKYMPQYGADFDYALRAAYAGFEVLICNGAIVYAHMESTGKGKPFVKQRLTQFAASYFNRYAQTSAAMWAVFVWRHGHRMAFVFTYPLVLVKLLAAYLTHPKQNQ